MTKFVIIVLFTYVVYYLGNIIYDLYLKKDTKMKTGDSEEFSLSEFADENYPLIKDIGIEDVENLNTPKSFSKNEFGTNLNIEESNNNDNLDSWRDKFEKEQDIDDFEDDSEKPSEDEKEVSFFKLETSNEVANNSEHSVRNEKKPSIKDILKEATTKIQVVENIDGYKTYHLA